MSSLVLPRPPTLPSLPDAGDWEYHRARANLPLLIPTVPTLAIPPAGVEGIPLLALSIIHEKYALEKTFNQLVNITH